jgi:hypothetical protein
LTGHLKRNELADIVYQAAVQKVTLENADIGNLKRNGGPYG